MKTAVVILNWNTEGYLERFLPGILASCEGLDAGLVVADSASSDGSLSMLRERFPEVQVIALDQNYGFTGGYNRALAQVDATYFVLMNSDIEVPSDWLKPLEDWMDTHPDCGVCGPKLRAFQDRDRFEYAGAAGGLLDRYGFPYCRGRILTRQETDRGQYDSPEDVLWITGACMMVRSSLWRDLGGLDDRFFAHMEEIDFCWRAQLGGWKVTVVPESVVYHIGGGTLPKESPFKLKLNFRNNLLLLDNNLARTFAAEGVKNPLCKARRRIFVRMLIDGAAAAVYLLTLRPASFKAVWEAHREFRRMRRPADPTLLKAQAPVQVKGWNRDKMIIFAKIGTTL